MKLSIVVPCFNEEQSLPLFYEELMRVLSAEEIHYELILVDDGSTDNTKQIIEMLCENNPAVRGIILSRNFGHQSALIAGIENSLGDAVLMMDSDLQHPPTLIPEMLQKLEAGFDVVNTLRLDTADSSFYKRLTSKWFYKLINVMSEIEIKAGAADFRVLSRKAANAFLHFSEKARFNRGLISWMGFKTAYISFEAPARIAGVSKYSTRKMLRFAKNGITSFSPKPLRIASVLGLIAVLVGFVYGVFILYQVFLGQTVEGWASTVLIILFLGGIQMLSIGILGEYISKIYDESKNRPLYFIQETIESKHKKGDV